MKYFIGTSGWTYDHWRGTFYPQDLARSRWFEYYCGIFNAVEINATFYRSFKDSTYQKWRDQAPQDFRYVVKIPRLISHRKKLVETDREIVDFGKQAQILADSFGMVLLQLAPSVKLDFEQIRAALKAFPDPTRVAVEFRHEKWDCEPTYALLKEMGAAFVCVDSPRTVLKPILTGRRAYMRLHGRANWYASDYTREELIEIARAARRLVDMNADEVFIFFNNDFQAYAPRNALALREILGS